ncbi:MAG: hypothetical protein ACRENX_04910 [Candidatus Dormibacteria bacterium]
MSKWVSPWTDEPRDQRAPVRAVTWNWRTIVAATAIVAVAIRVATLVLTHHLNGAFEYDDGVYFGSAVMLVHGHLPYRDFVLIQPPGLTLLLTPFALLANWTGTARALELARLAVPLVAGANVVLVGLLLRHRSRLVVAVGCLILAVYPDDILASTALLLEPFVILFCLLALVAIFEGDQLTSSRGRIFWAGVALGVGADVKLWAAFPAVILVLLWLPRPPRDARLVVSAAVGWLLPAIPFLVSAPVAFWHQVVVDQAGRTGASAIAPLIRLEFLTGVWPGLGVPPGHLYEPLAAAAVIGIAVVVLAGYGSSLSRPRRSGSRAASAGYGHLSQLELFALACTLLTGVALLVPADFFYHYAAFLGPFLALLLALAVGRLRRWQSPAGTRLGGPGGVRRAAARLGDPDPTPARTDPGRAARGSNPGGQLCGDRRPRIHSHRQPLRGDVLRLPRPGRRPRHHHRHLRKPGARQPGGAAGSADLARSLPASRLRRPDPTQRLADPLEPETGGVPRTELPAPLRGSSLGSGPAPGTSSPSLQPAAAGDDGVRVRAAGAAARAECSVRSNPKWVGAEQPELGGGGLQGG